MYVLSWPTVYTFTRVWYLCIFPRCFAIREINTKKPSRECTSSPYIIYIYICRFYIADGYEEYGKHLGDILQFHSNNMKDGISHARSQVFTLFLYDSLGVHNFKREFKNIIFSVMYIWWLCVWNTESCFWWPISKLTKQLKSHEGRITLRATN